MSHSPLHPPVPFADFEFTFDPTLSNIFPNPPPLPSSADLFSPSETTDLLGFLDNFGDFGWDFNNIAGNEFLPEQPLYEHVPPPIAPYSNPHLNTVPEPSTSSRASKRNGSARGSQQTDERQLEFNNRGPSQARSTTSESSSATTPTFSANPDPPPRTSAPRAKPLLSTPQKRLNHIMSEQKRRNAIRDGYAQLIALMAPAGSAPGIGMPTRGRPKGSGSRGKGQSKGKSGVLFRAVEYCRWLEEGRDSLQQEVIRVETAAGIRRPIS
ncbi:hypothetical protein M413DRAFT_439328 [Hebeloma cylindrosporum]|uniref:BHLH domain-containing protein n=1 Tax=Hebeloma cylindrosporum TaxID=76867 RepID=A0A0C3CFY7_HEBCY|nr:hypothetical protein M413DRAFT_439328 [Hebeloma cylindrosporum h7]